jgi:hypothetical protein
MRRWIIGVSLASAVTVRAATVSGTLELHGPAHPLDQAKVTLRYVSTVSGASSQEAQRTTPGPDGHFNFADVKPGIYVLQADGPGIVSAQWGSQGPGLAGHALVVHGDDSLGGLTMSVVSRPILCGKVFGADSKPLAGAMIQAMLSNAKGTRMSLGSDNPEGNTMGGQAISDASGEYRLERMSPGYYVLHAFLPDSPDHTPNLHPAGVFWRDAVDSDTATLIDFAPTGDPDRCSYDLHLRNLPGPYTGPRYRVEGSLVGGASKVWDRGLFWSLIPLDRPSWDIDDPGVRFHASSPSFSLDGVRPGRYQLTLRQDNSTVLRANCFSDRVDVSQELTVNGDMRDVRAELRAAAAVQGKVDEIHTSLDVPWPRRNDEQYSITLIAADGGCANGNAAPDGVFAFSDLEPGDYHVEANLPVEGRYTAGVELNRVPVTDDAVHLSAGENTMRVVERFDSGTIDVLIDAKRIDGSPARDEHNNWFGGIEHILLFDGEGRLVNGQLGTLRGQLKTVIPPGHYVAVAGTNAQLTSTFHLFDPRWGNQELSRAVAELGVPFEIKPGETANVLLPDRTIEIQNLTMKLGISMYGR